MCESDDEFGIVSFENRIVVQMKIKVGYDNAIAFEINSLFSIFNMYFCRLHEQYV